MGPGETIGLLAIIVVGIPVVLGIGLEVYKRHVSFKERQLELLATHRCDMFQGDHFCAPEPVEAIEAMLRSGRSCAATCASGSTAPSP